MNFSENQEHTFSCTQESADYQDLFRDHFRVFVPFHPLQHIR